MICNNGKLLYSSLGVAEEILAAERGGQWLLSCFGPFKEQPCIPGMDDVSPEEVRWEMYQGQKSGNVDQMKLQFQQLCSEMSSKREALKNPTHETALMLEKLQKGTKNPPSFSAKSNFTLSTPQLTNNPPANNVFAPKTYQGTSSTGTFGSFNSTSAVPSLFNRQNPSTSSVFGAKPAFGGSVIFGNQQNTNNSIFGGVSKPNNSVFGATQTMPTFGSTSQGGNSVFGVAATTSPTIFGQNSTNLFTNPQSNNLFPTSNASQNNLFANSTTITSVNPIFSNNPVAPVTSASIFGAPKNAAPFGAAPVFGSPSGFNSTPTPSVFSSQPPAFNPPASVFGTLAPTTSANHFVTQNANNLPFGNVISSTVPNSGTFGRTMGPFSAAHNVFGSTPSTPFASTTSTSSTSNPFAQKSQQAGGFISSPSGTSFGGMSSGPFGKTAVLDESVYTLASDLSDDEKNMYLSDQFILGKIPLNPPTIELR